MKKILLGAAALFALTSVLVAGEAAAARAIWKCTYVGGDVGWKCVVVGYEY